MKEGLHKSMAFKRGSRHHGTASYESNRIEVRNGISRLAFESLISQFIAPVREFLHHHPFLPLFLV